MRNVALRAALLWALTGGIVAPLAEPCAPQTQEPKPGPAKPTPDSSKMDMSKPMPATETVPNAPAAPQQEPPKAKPGTTALPNLSERSGWPSPTADSETNGFLLFDNFEYQSGHGPDALRWDILGWRGGDVHRFWFKSEGRQISSSSQGSEYEVQALYGKLIAPFFDLQAGLRFDQRSERDTKLI